MWLITYLVCFIIGLSVQSIVGQNNAPVGADEHIAACDVSVDDIMTVQMHHSKKQPASIEIIFQLALRSNFLWRRSAT